MTLSKRNFKNLSLGGALMALSLTVLSGCGESFQGTFVGEATVTSTSSCSRVAENPYLMEARVQLNGDEMDLTIIKLVPKSTQRADANNTLFAGIRVRTQLENDDSQFYVTEEDSGLFVRDVERAQISADGHLSPARDEITNLDYTIQAVVKDPSGAERPCDNRILANSLRLIK